VAVDRVAVSLLRRRLHDVVREPLLVHVVGEPDRAVAGDGGAPFFQPLLGALPGLVGLALGRVGARVALLTRHVAVQRGIPDTMFADPLPAVSHARS